MVFAALVLALLVPRLIPQSAEQQYLDDRELIRKRVLLYTSGYSPKRPTRVTSGEGRQATQALGTYPTFAMTNLGTEAALKEEDAGNAPITVLGVAGANPRGSKLGSGTPSWEDVDGDRRRNPAGDVLYYHNAFPAPTVDHWNTTAVDVNGTVYIVDSRDWFINMDLMLARRHLDTIPDSASPDNSIHGTGSYSWYVNEDFEVKSMFYLRPAVDHDEYQGVYP